MAIYEYPVTDKFQARFVTEPEFEPELFAPGEELYVDLDPVRGGDWKKDIEYDLGIDADIDQLVSTDDYTKIIFSGHRGCGKTTELKRLNTMFSGPDKYATIFISIESEVVVSAFTTEDFYVLLILKLVDKMQEAEIRADQSTLRDLADQLFNKEEFTREYSQEFSTEAGLETGGGFDVFGWLKFKTIFKGLIAGKSKSANIIRREIKQNKLEIINKLNLLLVDVRQSFKSAGKGKDLLFIIDGNEKILLDVYHTLFINDAVLINAISANMIIAVRIDAFYDIGNSPDRFSKQYIVPMVNLNKEGAISAMADILTKRIDKETFLTEDAMSLAIEYSGGCVRQMFLVVNRALTITRGATLTIESIEKSIRELGNRMRESLNNDHLAVLRAGNYETGEKTVKDLLQSLALLKYNGYTSIALNPLLKKFI